MRSNPGTVRWRWKDLPLRGKGLVVVAIPLIPLLVMGWLVYSSQRQSDEADRMVAHAFAVQAGIDRTQTLLVEAELGALAYLVSRSQDARAAFRAADDALPQALQRLDALVREQRQVERLQTLSVLASERQLNSIIDYAERTGPGAPMPLDLLQRSRELMAGARATLEDMREAEDVLLETRTAQARAARRRLMAATGGGVFLGLLGGAAAAVLFSAGIARRIAEVTANARRLAAGDPLAAAVPARDEVGQLAASLTAASDLLRERNDLLQRRLAALTKSNAELESFSYSVSHDLRAPLRHVAGFGGLLEKRLGPAPDPEAARYVRTIIESAARMGRLVDDLLAFSRMGRMKMNEEAVDLNDVVRDVVRAIEHDVSGRQIRWTTHPLPAVKGDPALMRLAFSNLISNAVKYTQTRNVAEIEIGTQPVHNGERVVYVRDNGVGFEMEYVHKLFGVFERLHSPDVFEGTGIGLANVRQIVARHGGRTWAEGAVDRGATFFLSLPAERELGVASAGAGA